MATLNSASHPQQYRMDHLHMGLGGHQNEFDHYYEGQFQPRHFEAQDRQYQPGSDMEQTGNSGRSTPTPPVPSSAELLSLYGPKPIRAQFACDYCRVRKAKCSGTEPCDRCLSKKRVCSFSSVQNQRKVTRSLKDLRAERTIGSPCRSPVSAGGRVFADGGPQSPYMRVGSGIGRRHSPNDHHNPGAFRRNDVGSLINVNPRPVLTSQSSGPTGWPYEWEPAQPLQDGSNGGFRRPHQAQAIGVQNQLHYLQPHQQHYLNSPGLDMAGSPLSAGGHFYSAQSSPSFFQNASQNVTPAMNAFGPPAQGGTGLGPAYSNAHFYAGIGQENVTAHGLSSLHLQQQHFQQRMSTQPHLGESSGSGSDEHNSQQSWRDSQSLLPVGGSDSHSGGQNMFSVGNEQPSQSSQLSPSHNSAQSGAPDKEETPSTQQSGIAEEPVQLQSRPSSANDGNLGSGSSLSLPGLSKDQSSSTSGKPQVGSQKEAHKNEEPIVGSPPAHEVSHEDLSVFQSQSASDF